MLKKLCYLAMAATLLSCTPTSKEESLDTLVSAQPESKVQSVEDYSTVLEEIKNKQAELGQKYAQAKTKKEKKAILDKSREFVLDKITNKLIPAWYGTRWEFYGDTETPRQGAIACGYFVNTVLQHAGFISNKKAMSEQLSEYIIKALTEEKNITRFKNISLGYFIKKAKAKGPGLYVIGLDYHTGFLVDDGFHLNFCHSSYLDPHNSVTCERAENSPPIIHSKYRVIGKILDDKLMEKWLKKEFIKTVKK